MIVFNHYGGDNPKCACCGEGNIKFLSIDHVYNNGNKHREEIKHYIIYNWLKSHGFPEGFQILCYNCNFAKAKNGGICPHNTHTIQEETIQDIININNTSGYDGIHWSKRLKKWRVVLVMHGIDMYFGIFDSKEEALKVRKDAEDTLTKLIRDLLLEFKSKTPTAQRRYKLNTDTLAEKKSYARTKYDEAQKEANKYFIDPLFPQVKIAVTEILLKVFEAEAENR